MIKIEDAQKKQATVIAHLIMEAMNHECCQWFAGPNHTLEDFHLLMTRLVEREDSQHSYLNTLVAITETNKIVGICISLPMRDNLQLRDSSGITPLSLFNHDSNEPIAYAKIRQRGEIGK